MGKSSYTPTTSHSYRSTIIGDLERLLNNDNHQIRKFNVEDSELIPLPRSTNIRTQKQQTIIWICRRLLIHIPEQAPVNFSIRKKQLSGNWPWGCRIDDREMVVCMQAIKLRAPESTSQLAGAMCRDWIGSGTYAMQQISRSRI